VILIIANGVLHRVPAQPLHHGRACCFWHITLRQASGSMLSRRSCRVNRWRRNHLTKTTQDGQGTWSPNHQSKWLRPYTVFRLAARPRRASRQLPEPLIA